MAKPSKLLETKRRVFPLLTKIIDAQETFPYKCIDDAYGLAHEGIR